MAITRTTPRPPAPPPAGADWQPRAGQQLSVLFDVFTLAARTRALLSEAMKDAGLRPDEYAAYSVVFERGPLTLTELTRTLHTPLTTVADYVRAMLRRKHARKDANPADQRSYLLVLTGTGRRAHQRASAAFERAYRAFVAELGELDEAHARMVLQALTGSAERALGRLDG